MNLILFVHPGFFNSASMPRFAAFIADSMRARGHTVSVWTSQAWFARFGRRKTALQKWLGYVDQLVIFPIVVFFRLLRMREMSVFIFTDQALGPWVPLVSSRPHVIHVHDFMALRSALDEFPENRVRLTGRLYQSLIRRGFARGLRFLPVSHSTESDLLRFVDANRIASAVVYNPMSFAFKRLGVAESAKLLADSDLKIPAGGFLLHVGGNQWYKNRTGVLMIYEEYVKSVDEPVPLWLVGEAPTRALREQADCVQKGQVKFVSGLSDMQVCAAYSAAKALLFPSISEGFGWPIAEAMACECLVLTTDKAPMTEVGAGAAFYLPVMSAFQDDWAKRCAKILIRVLSLPCSVANERRRLGLENVRRFDPRIAADAYEDAYKSALTECLHKARNA